MRRSVEPASLTLRQRRFHTNRYDRQNAGETFGTALLGVALRSRCARCVEPRKKNRLAHRHVAVEIAVGNPAAVVGVAERGRIGHTMVNPRACPRTCKHSFSAVISSGWQFERAVEAFIFRKPHATIVCSMGSRRRTPEIWGGISGRLLKGVRSIHVHGRWKSERVGRTCRAGSFSARRSSALRCAQDALTVLDLC